MKEFVINNEKLMQEWNWEKNNALGLFPDKLTCGTHKPVWWKCQKCKHEWMTSIGHRTNEKKPTNCPKCSSIERAQERQKKLQLNENISLKYPHLLEEWDYEKNKILPTEITKGSHEQIWWKCKNNHSWHTLVCNRIKGHNCPYCTGRFAVTGINDLKTINPKLAEEWNYKKNGDLRPELVKFASNKKVWWKCKNGHEWQASICNRNKKRGCPICSHSRRISVPEKAIYYYLSKIFSVEQNIKLPNVNMELDLFIPVLNLAVEYDGKIWHKNIKRDIVKDKYCFDNDITLVRIRELGTPQYDTTAKVINTGYPDLELLFLEPVLKELIDYINSNFHLNISPAIDIKKDYYGIISQIEKFNFDNSLSNKFPELLKEWNYEKNGNLKPENISAGSSRRVWWKCSKGHEWRTAINNRTNTSNQNQCPYCQNKKTDVGINDIVTLKCDFLIDWDYNKNDLPPNQYMKHSGKFVWWKCSKCGFEWKASIDQRSKHGCRYCCRKEAREKRLCKVINVDTNQIFNSAIEASKHYGISDAGIRRVCRGERKTYGGYHWKYLEEGSNYFVR